MLVSQTPLEAISEVPFFETLSRIAKRKGTLDVFVRDDDLTVLTDELRRLVDLSLATGVPISFGVIPAAVQDDAIAYIRPIQRKYPNLIELHQHGWAHVNHEPGNGRGEFGPARSYSQQFEDIRAGKERLEALLGDGLYPAFSPPWNRSTPDTARALLDLGFRLLSAEPGFEPAGELGLLSCPVTIDFQFWGDKGRMKPPSVIMMLMLKALLHDQSPLGLMLHHGVIPPASLKFVHLLFRRLVESGFVRFHTFRTLVETRGAAFLPAPAVPVTNYQTT